MNAPAGEWETGAKMAVSKPESAGWVNVSGVDAG